MTEEERRFKILKRTSYEEQISQENKEITKNTFLFGLSAVAAISILFTSTLPNIDAATKLVDVGLGLLNTGFGVYSLKDLIQAIGKKTMLQGKVDELVDELKLDEIERGR